MVSRITAILNGGRKEYFTKSELREMLADKGMYRDADNLPKWIYLASKLDRISTLPRTWRGVWEVIELISTSTNSVVIDVRSDDPGKNRISIDRT